MALNAACGNLFDRARAAAVSGFHVIMRFASLILLTGFFAVFLWSAAEISAFFYVADKLGLIGAILLMAATSYLGIALLRRIGEAARQNLFDLLRRADRGFTFLNGGLRDGVVGALGAILLILPGFLSDAIGIVLALASAGFWWRPSVEPRRTGEDVIDLTPGDWRNLDAAGHLPKKP